MVNCIIGILVIRNPNDQSDEKNPTYTYTGPGIFTVTLSSRDGCDVQTSLQITANAIEEVLDETTLSCFKEPVELNPVFNPVYMYTWTPIEGLSDPNVPNPTASVDTNTWYYVTIKQASLANCSIVDSILVLSPEDFNAFAGADDTICSFTPVTLTGASDLNNPDHVFWLNELGDTISHQNVVIVTPDTTRQFTFYVVNEFGCTTSDVVTVYRTHNIDPCILPEDTSYCNIQTITLNACDLPGNIVYLWLNTNGDTIGVGPSIDVTPGTPTNFVLLATDELGCQDNELVRLTPTFLICISPMPRVFALMKKPRSA